MNLIITSEHRVGSRWLHYILTDLYDMYPTPEIDAEKIRENETRVRSYFSQGGIAKFHHATHSDILEAYEPWDYKIIGVVRNPMDRIVSQTFHNRYHHMKDVFKQSEFNTDEEAIRYTVLEDPFAKRHNENQLKLMLPGYSTKNKILDKLPYIWTCYEWMHQNIQEEVKRITSWLEVENITDEFFEKVIRDNSFEVKARRKRGQEDRANLWQRKGILGDWKNWFDDELIEATRGIQEEYQSIIRTEARNGN
jgi:hypothetical protein